jgi:hypothetical protein
LTALANPEPRQRADDAASPSPPPSGSDISGDSGCGPAVQAQPLGSVQRAEQATQELPHAQVPLQIRQQPVELSWQAAAGSTARLNATATRITQRRKTPA